MFILKVDNFRNFFMKRKFKNKNKNECIKQAG